MIGAENATRVYRQLVQRTLNQVRHWMSERTCQATLYYTGGTAGDAQAEFGAELAYGEQIGSSLGQRLQHATRSAFDAGAKRVVVIGTDCPSLTSEDLEAAYEQLEKHDVVLGPANDGGYYLIGLNADRASLFDGIEWSTSAVFEQTRQKASMLKLSMHVLRKLPDVDYPEDLLPLRSRTECHHFPLQTQAGKLSVIVPTLNEELNLPATLNSIGLPDHDLEVIVLDAGSSDQTVAIARRHGCKVFVGNRGRANQMNAGASIASGEYLMFLHADSRLPEGYRGEIKRLLDSSVACGAFPLEIDAPGLPLRMIEWGVAFRSRVLQLPYGDQALFFRAADFYEQNGFKPLVIMEDYELVVRMRRTGRIGLAHKAVRTAPRRWIQQGILRTTLVNQLCLIAYWLGCSDTTIARLYRGRSV